MSSKNRQRLGLVLALSLTLNATPSVSQQDDDDLLLTMPLMGDEMVPLSRMPNYRNQMRDIFTVHIRANNVSHEHWSSRPYQLIKVDQADGAVSGVDNKNNIEVVG
jgi:hypothetical protein